MHHKVATGGAGGKREEHCCRAALTIQIDGMSRLRHSVFLVLLGVALSGCQQLSRLSDSGLRSTGGADVNVAVSPADAATPRPQARPGSTAAGLGSAGLRPEQLDQTSATERAAALAPPAARTQFLGETLASLGSPADPGLWLRTGLVTSATAGRIELAQGEGSLRVELRPSGAAAGGGSQLSLAAFTTLNLPLTQLVALRVYAE